MITRPYPMLTTEEAAGRAHARRIHKYDALGDLKTILRDAAHELERRRYQGPIGPLLKPLEKLAEDPASHAGGSDSVIFLSPGIFRHLRLLAPTQERLIVASHPHITSVLAHLMTGCVRSSA